MILSVSKMAARTAVLGPGLRAVVWVRGCPLRCAGCLAPEDLPFEGGQRWEIEELADWLGQLPQDITGVTFSGGEPMSQAEALSSLVTHIRRERDWSVMAYSGFTIEHLRQHGDSGQHALLAQLDILVDGPYVAAKHGALLWRGSSNQRLHLLTGRHELPAEQSAGIEVHVGQEGLQWIGVPPAPGFREQFEQAMAAEGIQLGEGASDVR